MMVIFKLYRNRNCILPILPIAKCKISRKSVDQLQRRNIQTDTQHLALCVHFIHLLQIKHIMNLLHKNQRKFSKCFLLLDSFSGNLTTQEKLYYGKQLSVNSMIYASVNYSFIRFTVNQVCNNKFVIIIINFMNQAMHLSVPPS